MDKIAPQPSIPLKQQLATLKNSKILFAHITMFLFLAGHMLLYAYFTPFLKTILGLDATWVSIVYLVFCISAINGGVLSFTLYACFVLTLLHISFITVFDIVTNHI